MTDISQQIPYNSRLARYPKPAIALTAVTYVLLGFIETLPGKVIPPLLYFLALGILALYLMPYVVGLPNGRKSLGDYCLDIRLLPMRPLWRNILLGLLMATLTLSSILLASLLTKHFVLDWSTVPALRWLKGLTRGIWEEVFFRGIILAMFMRLYRQRRAVLLSSFLFAVVHLNPMALNPEMIVDTVSLFFMGLLFIYIILKSGSLLPAIVFHYLHDIFVLLVQNAPGADKILATALLYSFLWVAFIIGAVLTKYIVEHWPIKDYA
ncbi:MAG: CPBP family intramembrane metalloprotease [Sedimentisphaerales bacterium]|nr:CPBP family intramembrane metalloprotease [Sedimentisphaerales bacterium]